MQILLIKIDQALKAYKKICVTELEDLEETAESKKKKYFGVNKVRRPAMLEQAEICIQDKNIKGMHNQHG